MADNAPEAYPFIRAWGRMLGSYGDFIEDEIERARRDGAPANAIYSDGPTWHTTDGIKRNDVRALLGLEPLEEVV